MRLSGKLTLLIATVTGAGIVAGGAALAARIPDTDDPAEVEAQEAFTTANQDKAAMSQSEAEAIAQGAHGGDVVSIHLEDDGAGLEWETEVDDGQAVWEVNVNAQTGAVNDSEADDQEGSSDDQNEPNDDADEPNDDADEPNDDADEPNDDADEPNDDAEEPNDD
jgi:acylglycerol lipase